MAHLESYKILFDKGTTEYSEIELNFRWIINYVINSPFFLPIDKDQKVTKINKYIFKEIDLKHIDFPQRLRLFLNGNNINNLSELLELEPKDLLRKRNIGRHSIIKAKRIILSYLCSNEKCLENLCKKIIEADKQYSTLIIEKYFPLLRGIYQTTEFYYTQVNNNISCIKIPARIKDYIKKNPEILTIADLLSINYNDLRRIDKIGDRTIKSLQYTLIELLRLEKVSAVPQLAGNL